MSRGYVFSYDPADGNPDCDICQIPTMHGATLVHLEGRPGVAALVACTTCAVEIAFTIIREFYRRTPPIPPDKVPTVPPAAGGGST